MCGDIYMSHMNLNTYFEWPPRPITKWLILTNHGHSVHRRDAEKQLLEYTVEYKGLVKVLGGLAPLRIQCSFLSNIRSKSITQHRVETFN